MDFILLLSIFVALLSVIDGSGRVEHHTVTVHVEHVKKTMVVVTESTCFMVKLTQTELQQAKSDLVRERLLVTVFCDIIGFAPEHQIYHSDPGLTPDMFRWCGDRDIYLLMRDALNTSTSSVSTIHQTSTTVSQTTSSPTVATTRRSNPQPVTTSVAGPVIMYDTTLSMKAVIVTSSGCFVYRMTEIDRNLLKLGTIGKDMFERALLSKDRSITRLAELTGSLGYMATEIQNACSDKAYLLP